jgi:hypothetical protein
MGIGMGRGLGFYRKKISERIATAKIARNMRR